jgi:hypothetical protein
MEAGRQTRPPRGALAVVLVGLLATAAAARLSTEGPLGSTSLSWLERAALPASRPAALPGGGEMRLARAAISATEANGSGYRLYRVVATLRIGPGASPKRGLVRCTVQVPAVRALIAHTPETRAAYPLPSTELSLQLVPGQASIEFSSAGAELARVGLGDAFRTFVNRPGVVVEWEPFEVGWQGWEWRLPPRRFHRRLRLSFASIWRTSGTPAARIACRTGSASVTAAGTLPGG